MNFQLISRYNSVVGPRDTCLILGDFAVANWGSDAWPHTLEDAARALNGRKILIVGNHDTPQRQEVMKEAGFQIWDYLVFPQEKLLFTHKYNYRKNLRGINMSVENWNYTPVPLDAIIKFGKGEWLNVAGHSHGRWRTREPKVKN